MQSWAFPIDTLSIPFRKICLSALFPAIHQPIYPELKKARIFCNDVIHAWTTKFMICMIIYDNVESAGGAIQKFTAHLLKR